MAHCRDCGGEHAPEDLTRHERETLVVVHCPECGALMGRYRRHGDRA